MEEIATSAETSRATLYQYFESKEAIFIELMRQSGGALSGVTRRIGPLGPNAEGYDNLHWWLSEWSWVFDRYAAMFIEWANVNSPRAPLRPKLAQFVDVHTEQLKSVLAASGFEGDPTPASLLTLALANRYNYIRHVYRPNLSGDAMIDGLAIAIQLFLFPATPTVVLTAGPRHGRRNAPPGTGFISPPAEPLAALPKPGSDERPSPFSGLSPQATKTVRHLLEAAGRVFAATGYGAAKIDQIATEAALARGTFYRYFDDKLDLMRALSHEASAAMCPLFVEFERFADPHDPSELRDWLRRYLALQQRYAGVLRAWTEGFPIDPVILARVADVVAALRHATVATYGPVRSYPLHRSAAGMLLAGLLEHFPNEGTGTRHEPSVDDIVETQAMFIERVLLAR